MKRIPVLLIAAFALICVTGCDFIKVFPVDSTTGDTQTQDNHTTTGGNQTTDTDDGGGTGGTTDDGGGGGGTTIDITGDYEKDFGGYYKTISDSMTADQLKTELKEIINKNVSTSYDWSRYEAADEDPNNPNNIVTIYARTSLGKKSHVNSKNVGWNREHTFPQSKITGNATSDNHIIFASDAKVNGTRSNKKLAELTGSSGAKSVEDSYGNPTVCKSSSDYFDPGDTPARGMVARSTMYAAIMYGLNISDNFDKIATAVKWHLQYLPNSADLKRNETVYSKQHNRNPFVDYPKLVCKLWGNTNSETKLLCEGK